MWGIGIASEKIMRVEASELVGENLGAELTPFTFTHKDGGEVIENAPMAYIPNLWEKIKSLLDQNEDDSRGYANDNISRLTFKHTTLISVHRTT